MNQGTLYLGRLHPGPMCLTFSEDELLGWLDAEDESSLEREATTWLAYANTPESELEDLHGEDALWIRGHSDGRGTVLADLAWLTKGIDVPQKNVIRDVRRGRRDEVNITIHEVVREIIFDLPDAQEPAPPKMLEDLRETFPPKSLIEQAPFQRRLKKRPDADRRSIVEQAVALRKAEGLSLPRLAERIGMTEGSLQPILRDAGIKLAQICPAAYHVTRTTRDRKAIVAEVLRLRAEDPTHSLKKLAEIMNLPPGTISSYMHAEGARLPPPPGMAPKPHHDRAELVAAAVRLRCEDGLYQKEAAAKLGVSQTWLCMCLKDAGIEWNDIEESTAPKPAKNTPENIPAATQSLELEPKITAPASAITATGIFGPRKPINGAKASEPPIEDHIAILNPDGKTLRYVVLATDRNVERARKAAVDWAKTMVRTGAAAPGRYRFVGPGKKEGVTVSIEAG